MKRRDAAIVGAGVGGLAAAAGLQRRGWTVTVFERASAGSSPGSGISLWPNALRALKALGVEACALDGATLSGRSGVRTPGGRWVARTDIADAVQRRFGMPLMLLRRESLLTALREQLAQGSVQDGVTAQSLRTAPDDAVLQTSAGQKHADLAVIADGAHSRLRGDLFPDHPGLRYAGYTSWRMIAARPASTEPAETWGAPRAALRRAAARSAPRLLLRHRPRGGGHAQRGYACRTARAVRRLARPDPADHRQPR